MRDKIFIVAGNHEQFNSYRRKKIDEAVANNKPIKASDFVYVHTPDALRGYRNVHGFFIGTYYERRDLEEIKLQIQLANR